MWHSPNSEEAIETPFYTLFYVHFPHAAPDKRMFMCRGQIFLSRSSELSLFQILSQKKVEYLEVYYFGNDA